MDTNDNKYTAANPTMSQQLLAVAHGHGQIIMQDTLG